MLRLLPLSGANNLSVASAREGVAKGRAMGKEISYACTYNMHFVCKLILTLGHEGQGHAPPSPAASPSPHRQRQKSTGIVGNTMRDEEGRATGKEVSYARAHNMHFICKYNLTSCREGHGHAPPSPAPRPSPPCRQQESTSIIGGKMRDKEGRATGKEVSYACAYILHFVSNYNLTYYL